MPAVTDGTMKEEWRRAALDCLLETDPVAKCQRTLALWQRCQGGRLALDAGARLPVPAMPGRPARPALVAPGRVPRRRFGSRAGRGILLHALAHIEFNAINLAWDAVCRFPGLPADFYADWSRIAAEEARHFQLLCGRLSDHGLAYGDLPAHDGLWAMARRTAADPLARMALVPRVLEARGLDVTPAMIERFRQVGDGNTAEVLGVILREEVGHVQAGSRWYFHLCARRGLAPLPLFRRLLLEYMQGRVKGPFHRQARREAGFTEEEMQMLEDMELRARTGTPGSAEGSG